MNRFKLAMVLILLFGVRREVQACDVLMIDLNNSGQEINHCNAGVQAANISHGTDDQTLVIGNHKLITPRGLDKAIKKWEDAHPDGCIDSVVISGHDGNGHFFGENSSRGILASDLKEIVNKHPRLKDSLTSMALWGCYTATDNACENYWMKNISPNIRTSIGFTLQSPDNKKPGNWRLIEDFCKKRQDIVNAQTAAERNRLFRGLDNIRNWNVGVCFADGLCSDDYASKLGERHRTCYHSYAELNERCGEFDPDRKQTEMMKNYLSAQGPDFANPPDDDDSAFTSSGENLAVRKSQLRNYYGAVHLWRHCARRFNAETGFKMPKPEQVIRLIKFKDVKTNFAHFEKPLLEDYNEKLRALGLNEYTIDNLRHMSRAEIVSSTAGAVASLKRVVAQESGSQLINGVDPAKLLVMAKGIDLSLRLLDYHCSHFSWVHDIPDPTPSPCLSEYGSVPSWPPHQ